ncbi:MAG TPA: PhoD-like phosphatase N-terminal domain-containing protein, partial [Microlunatus sp.]
MSSPVSRRRFIHGVLGAGGAAAVGGLITGPGTASAVASPRQSRAGRPALTHGLQSGDVTSNSATIWTRADREARMLVEISRDPDFRRSHKIPGAWLRSSSDFTGKTVINGLPSGTDLYYRVTPYGRGDHDL